MQVLSDIRNNFQYNWVSEQCGWMNISDKTNTCLHLNYDLFFNIVCT